ncbi:hypothetical protein AVEN_53953-1 [Araneus ventricosus]|uniref:Uncharacterized protein n=1 Tax=Araneus ventricosus TaxID=182803 RepID=A0A4Y2PZW6_ARAVE|nr:hypothetical protein AVEN_53953-1 [Araneus ventricosus]
MPSINTKLPSPDADMHLHTRTPPPPYLTVPTKFLGLSSSFFLLHTIVRPSEPKMLNLLSSARGTMNMAIHMVTHIILIQAAVKKLHGGWLKTRWCLYLHAQSDINYKHFLVQSVHDARLHSHMFYTYFSRSAV